MDDVADASAMTRRSEPMQLLRVNMRDLSVRWEGTPDVYEHLGGRGIIARLLLEEVPPTCDPLGPQNKLIIAPGLLGGAGVTTAGRLSIGAKSPLTGGTKEANAGGTAGDTLGRLGIKAIVVEGQPTEAGLHILLVGAGSASLVPAGEVMGLGTYASSEALHQRFGTDSTIITIGPAGEQRLIGAAIVCTGEGEQVSNIAARGGLGGVMGSKGLKAIVIQPAASKSVPLADAQLFRSSARRFAQELLNDPKLGPKGGTHIYGTAAITAAVNEMGSLPTRSFTSGSFEGASDLRGEKLREVILARGGRIGTRCMPGCVIACRNVYVDESGTPIVGTLQYETIALLGSNLGLADLDQVGRLNHLCNDLGLDTIESGAALGVAIEAGLATFGDFESIASLLRQVEGGTDHGRLIGSGAVATGRALGVRRVPAALGQAMPGYDPRSLKGNGLTYITSPQGADHTAGNAFGARKEVNPLGVEGQARLSLKLQILAAMLDSTGLCLFARPPVVADPQLMVDMLNGRFGWGWTKDDLDRANREVLRAELEFNRRAGVVPAAQRMPEYMRQEPLPPHGATFDLPDSEIGAVFEEL
jgi:aldehyde:ferredoxin oxidoreductase